MPMVTGKRHSSAVIVLGNRIIFCVESASQLDYSRVPHLLFIRLCSIETFLEVRNIGVATREIGRDPRYIFWRFFP